MQLLMQSPAVSVVDAASRSHAKPRQAFPRRIPADKDHDSNYRCLGSSVGSAFITNNKVAYVDSLV